MPEMKDITGDSAKPAPFPEWLGRLDSSLRLTLSLIGNGDTYQLHQRTGIVGPKKSPMGGAGKAPAPTLPITLELSPQYPMGQLDALSKFTIGGLSLFRKELEVYKKLRHVPAALEVDPEDLNSEKNALGKKFENILAVFPRMSLGVPAQPTRGPSLGDIGIPAMREYKGTRLTGKGIVIGIIDDGCAFAHRDFIRQKPDGTLESRIQCLWDQGAVTSRTGWVDPKDSYGNTLAGQELRKQKIDELLNMAAYRSGNFIVEDRIYSDLQYRPGSVSSHGTHVMDIAAGSGESLMGQEGVACDADIIFVQLPAVEIEAGARYFEQSVMTAAGYILERAAGLPGSPPVVINLSYGGYDGPHDGTSGMEQFLDALLSVPNRAMVISAGNGFEANCHASDTVRRGGGWFLRWVLPSHDPTDNSLEIWYDRNCSLEVRLVSPGPAIAPADWIPFGFPQTPIALADGKVVGYVEHLDGGTGNGNAKIFVNLRATASIATVGNNAAAPSGTWRVELRNTGSRDAVFHAWIHRDDSGRSASARLRQSRFHEHDADPTHTVTGWACGSQTIAVGAYNVATREVCKYSACGPARAVGVGVVRPKPDIYAPAEETARGGGVLSASSLSGRPSRMNGTSAAAPHVAGLIALIFEYAVKLKRNGQLNNLPSAMEIRDALVKTADRDILKKNRHQIADKRVPVKQGDVWGPLHLNTSGKVNLQAALDELFGSPASSTGATTTPS